MLGVVCRTSDFVGDVLLGGDDLVHVCPYGGLQGGAGGLTLLQHSLMLGLALGLYQAVYCITDLHTGEMQQKESSSCCSSFICKYGQT